MGIEEGSDSSIPHYTPVRKLDAKSRRTPVPLLKMEAAADLKLGRASQPKYAYLLLRKRL